MIPETRRLYGILERGPGAGLWHRIIGWTPDHKVAIHRCGLKGFPMESDPPGKPGPEPVCAECVA